MPDSPGVTSGTSRDTLVLEYNDIDALTETFADQGEEIAAIILEPIVGNMGCVPPHAGLPRDRRRELCNATAAC